jgi:hypothetical protein
MRVSGCGKLREALGRIGAEILLGDAREEEVHELGRNGGIEHGEACFGLAQKVAVRGLGPCTHAVLPSERLRRG